MQTTDKKDAALATSPETSAAAAAATTVDAAMTTALTADVSLNEGVDVPPGVDTDLTLPHRGKRDAEERIPVRGAELGHPVIYHGEHGDEAARVCKVHDEYTGLVNLQVDHGDFSCGSYLVTKVLPQSGDEPERRRWRMPY